MNEVNQTLFIPLYGKAKVSKQGIILRDPAAERIWAAEGFPIRGKSRSKWLCYNMAMRARVFDDWTETLLKIHPEAVALHIGCGLDSRFERVSTPYKNWFDCDLPDVIALRKKHFAETENYHMLALDASDPETLNALPEAPTAIVVLEGLSMYLKNDRLLAFLNALQSKYPTLHVLMDIYTEFGAKASKYKNPINDVGVTQVYGVKDMKDFLKESKIRIKAEHSFTPERLIKGLKPMDSFFFRLLFTGSAYRKIYRLYELEAMQ